MNDKRYYYTDPLAAAWMAKHFGMKIHAPIIKGNGDYGESENPLPVWYWARKIEQAETDRDFLQERYCIQTDSLQLLGPRDGDLVEYHGDLCEYQIHWWNRKLLWESGINEIKRILQRGGITFHWPESEAA